MGFSSSETGSKSSFHTLNHSKLTGKVLVNYRKISKNTQKFTENYRKLPEGDASLGLAFFHPKELEKLVWKRILHAGSRVAPPVKNRKNRKKRKKCRTLTLV